MDAICFAAKVLHAQQALSRVKLDQWASEVLMLVPRGPDSFPSFVHYVEGLSKAYETWSSLYEVHAALDVSALIEARYAVTELARASRAYWESYKDLNGLVRL